MRWGPASGAVVLLVMRGIEPFDLGVGRAESRVSAGVSELQTEARGRLEEDEVCRQGTRGCSHLAPCPSTPCVPPIPVHLPPTYGQSEHSDEPCHQRTPPSRQPGRRPRYNNQFVEAPDHPPPPPQALLHVHPPPRWTTVPLRDRDPDPRVPSCRGSRSCHPCIRRSRVARWHCSSPPLPLQSDDKLIDDLQCACAPPAPEGRQNSVLFAVEGEDRTSDPLIPSD